MGVEWIARIDRKALLFGLELQSERVDEAAFLGETQGIIVESVEHQSLVEILRTFPQVIAFLLARVGDEAGAKVPMAGARLTTEGDSNLSLSLIKLTAATSHPALATLTAAVHPESEEAAEMAVQVAAFQPPHERDVFRCAAQFDSEAL